MRFSLAFLIACSSSTGPTSKTDGGQVTLDPAGTAEQYVATIIDNERVEGQLVATYDQNDVQACALYSSRFDDEPLRFITPCDLRNFVTTPRPASFHTFRAMLEEHGVALAPPIGGVATIILGNDCQHRAENGSSNFAWDLARADVGVATVDGCPQISPATLNEVYEVWHNPVFAPIAGTVDEVESDIVDHAPGTSDSDHPNGNYITIKLQGLPISVALLHLEHATIPRPAHVDSHTGLQVASTCAPEVPDVACIAPGATIELGQLLGRVGDSGQSLVPHLHVGAMWASDKRSWSVPVEWHDVYLTADAPSRDRARPATGAVVSARAF